MDIQFLDNNEKVKVVGATIIVQCKTCGSRYGFRLLDGFPPPNWNYCIKCSIFRDAKKGEEYHE